MNDLRVAFYGDDFTGSTDAMMALSVAGVETVLFTDPPDRADLERFEDVDAIGLAGRSRSMSPAEMEAELGEKFDALAGFGAPIVHYKVCSTFDSSPEVGSIGRAIDVGQGAFDSPFVPVVVGVPELGRYVVFANHFATVDGTTHRLDRHPVMSDHPVTPMTESDLRRHLGEQTTRSIGGVDVLALDRPADRVDEAVDEVAADDEIVVFDTLTDEHLAEIGRVLWGRGRDADRPLFTVGSSGVEYALADRWRREGLIDGDAEFPALDPVERLVVMSGSASPVTDDQIERGLAEGFDGVRLDAAALVVAETAADERGRAVREGIAALEGGRSVLLYSARGPADPAIDRTRRAAERNGVENVERVLGREQGRILARVLEESGRVLEEGGIERACVAGGDTCGHVASALEVWALETIAPTAPGSPICRAHSRTAAFDGLELALKGGQLGQEDYFERVRLGE